MLLLALLSVIAFSVANDYAGLNDDKTLVFYRTEVEGEADGAFVRSRGEAWSWHSGVGEGVGRCSADCATNVFALAAHHRLPCHAIHAEGDEDACGGCCAASECRRGKEPWSAFFAPVLHHSGAEGRACVCCFHGQDKYGYYEHKEPASNDGQQD